MKTRYVSFIVRVRADVSPTGRSGLQGSIQQTGSPQIHAFASFDRLVELLSLAVGDIELEPPLEPPGSRTGDSSE